MTFRPLQSRNKRRSTQFVSSMARKGVNQKQNGLFMNADYALDIVNYLPISEGSLVRRDGIRRITEYVGVAPSMIEPFGTDYLMFAYDTTLAVYQISADTITVIKNDFTSSLRYTGDKYGDYFFVGNGVDKIWRIDNSAGWTATEVINSIAGSQNIK